MEQKERILAERSLSGKKGVHGGTDWSFIAPDLQVRLPIVHTTMDCRTCFPHAYGDIYGVHVRSRRVLPSFQVRNREKRTALAARNREIDFLHAGVTESDKSHISWWTGMMAQETISASQLSHSQCRNGRCTSAAGSPSQPPARLQIFVILLFKEN